MRNITLALAASMSVSFAVVAQDKNTSSQSVYLIQKQSAMKLAASSEALRYGFHSYCVDDIELADLQTLWGNTMSAWMYLQGQERGPDAALERSWSVQFWPDKKNTTGRKMAQLLSSSSPITVDSISQESVTVQGVGAVEWLLFDESSPIGEDRSSACRVGKPISENLENNADTILAAWGDNPWKDIDPKQWHSEYLALLSNQIDYSMKKLSRPMAKLGKPKPYFSESWRSQTSLSNLKHNILALESLYLANGNGLDKILREQGKSQVADSIKDHFFTMKSTWPEESSLFALLKTKEGYRQALSQYNKFENLNYLIHEEAAVALGVVVGFNATDGD